ncbi:MAG: hypothetical protein ABIP51_20390 [Bacteroidia bacterium]
MKTNIIKIAFIALIATTVISSCSKYADGPKFSLLTKKARLCNEWSIESVSTNGNDQTAAYKTLVGDNYVLDIEKNGTYKVSGNFTDDGTWKLGEDKDDVYFMSSKSGAMEQANRILRLKSKELWLRTTASNGDKTIIKYKQ